MSRRAGWEYLPAGSLLRRMASSLADPAYTGPTRSAVRGLIAISPAVAICSMRTVRVAPGPVITSSRWASPTRKRWNVPLWIPTDIRSDTNPAEVCRRLPIRRRRARIRCAARQARRAWSGPVNRRSTASPPHLRTPPPSSYAIDRSCVKQSSRTSLISSAPTLPRRASRSHIEVKPEMSTKASVPSGSAYGVAGPARSHSIRNGGMYGRRAPSVSSTDLAMPPLFTAEATPRDMAGRTAMSTGWRISFHTSRFLASPSARGSPINRDESGHAIDLGRDRFGRGAFPKAR